MPDLERPSVDEPSSEPPFEPESSEPEDDLSPSVRRLVRHYDLDITGLHGTGPAGRIRVGDVIALLGGRAALPASETPRDADIETANDDDEVEALLVEASSPRPAAAARNATLVFECDLSRVLVHQKRAREQGEAVELDSYFAFAAARALEVVPEVNADPARVDIAVKRSGTDTWRVLYSARGLSLGDIDAVLKALAESPQEGAVATFALRHYGAGGAVFAFPIVPEEHTHATLAVGKLRRIVAVKTVNGEDTPRITAQCYLSLGYDAAKVDEARAMRFLSACVRVLEDYNTAAMASAT